MAARLLIALAAGSLGVAGLEAPAGRALFERPWVLPPSSLHGQSGLGPLYDARACGACHGGDAAEGSVVRLGDPHGAPDPVYGAQLQRRAAPGLEPEAAVAVSWRSDGVLRSPRITPQAPAYGPLDPSTRLSLRRPPRLEGIGLLEAVPDAEILARVHPGVSGRAARLTDGRLGRWGWKADQPALEGKIAAALSRDMGVSSALRPEPWGDCTSAQAACRHAARTAGGGMEAPPAALPLLAAYLRSLPAPAAERSPRGEAIFLRAGCAGCHAVLHTADGRPVRAYTDLLLHNLGPGLDDGVGEGAAAPAEWRTAPLWGLGSQLRAGGLLHDGRARTVEEAVAWHGGEADRSRARYAALSPVERRLLDSFLLTR